MPTPSCTTPTASSSKLTVFNVALPNKGQRIERPLKKAGLVRVECDAHGWMLAWIYVAENPYYAVTSKDGRFTITDVPPGSYTLVAWQEYTGADRDPGDRQGEGGGAGHDRAEEEVERSAESRG